MERLPRGKQAGPNRIPNEMYKVMPVVFAKEFAALANESIKKRATTEKFSGGGYLDAI